jgi:8-oxo-dGTP diphosphatase
MATETMIETARLRIRCFRDDDLADLVALVSNWEVARWVATMPYPYTEAAGREWIALVGKEHATGRPRRFAITLREDDRLIGGTGLDGSAGDGSTEPALGYSLVSPIGARGAPEKPSPPSSNTGSARLAWKRSAPIPTRATRDPRRCW